MTTDNSYSITKTITQPSGEYPLRVSVKICDSATSNIKPSGTHLRWFPPKSLGFPKHSKIYKINEADWKGLQKQRFNFKSSIIELRENEINGKWVNKEGKQVNETVADAKRRIQKISIPIGTDDALTLEIITNKKGSLKKTKEGLKVVELQSENANVLIHFSQPILYLEIDLASPFGSSKTRCFYKSTQIASSDMSEHMSFELPNITDVLIPLNFETIEKISCITEQSVIDLCEGRNNHDIDLNNITKAPTIQKSYEAIFNLINPVADIHNFFIDSPTTEGTILKKYLTPVKATNGLSIIDGLKLLHNGTKTVLFPAQHGQSETTIPILDYLNLAALDPNIARMLGLYWIDLDDSQHQPYLYIIKSSYTDNTKTGNHGFAFTHSPEEIPQLSDKIVIEQLSGITYKDRRPLAQLGLNWDHPSHQYDLPSRPVFYDIYRTIGSIPERITENKPHMVNSKAKYCFRDAQLPINQPISYQIIPIDIFGREGKGINTKSIKLKDLKYPVAPKNIKAKIIQNGFPWDNLDSEELEHADINKGAIHLSLEYGETQSQLSPDAKQLTLFWKKGSKGDDFDDLSTWTNIKSIEIAKTRQGNIIWDNNNYKGITNFSFTIKHVIRKTAEESHQQLERLNSLSFNSSEPLLIQEDKLELLLDQAILEPNIFRGYTILLNNNEYTVLDSHAGLAYDTDLDSEKRYTARLIVKEVDNAGIYLVANKTIWLSNKELNLSAPFINNTIKNQDYSGFSQRSPLALLQIDYPFDNQINSGGEIALDYQYYLNQSDDIIFIKESDDLAGKNIIKRTFIAKIVSDINSGSTTSSSMFIARFKVEDYLYLLLIQKSFIYGSSINPTPIQCRLYPPYILSDLTLGLNGESGDTSFKLNCNQPFETLWFSAIAKEYNEERTSSLAIPFEAKVMNPPLIVKNIPIPWFSDKYAPPANVDGYSYPLIQWDAVELPPLGCEEEATAPTIVKYELARALDTSIIATDKKNWLQGHNNSEIHDELNITSEVTVTGKLENYIPRFENGTFSIEVVDNDDLSTLKTIEKGRIKISGVYHQFLKFIPAKDVSDKNIILCKPSLKLEQLNIAANIPFIVEKTPDYSLIENNDEALQDLANTNYPRGESAFSLVTSVGVYGLEFTDTIPGKGSNRYFYRLRVVDPSENKSKWSLSSNGVYQIPFPPEIIKNIEIIKFNNKLMVSWRKSDDINIAGYKIYSKNKNELSILSDISIKNLLLKPRFIPENLLIFPKPIMLEAIDSEDEYEINAYISENILTIGEGKDGYVNLYGGESYFLYEIGNNSDYIIKGLSNISISLYQLEVIISVDINNQEDIRVCTQEKNVYYFNLKIDKGEVIIAPYLIVNNTKIIKV